MESIELNGKTYILKSDKKGIESYSDFVGKKIFIRTITYHLTGRVVNITNDGIMFLESASWIADSGRFMDFLKSGVPDEVEPVGDWFLSISSIVDGTFWKHDLPMEQK